MKLIPSEFEPTMRPSTRLVVLLKHFAILAIIPFLCSCTPQSGGGYDAAYQQQLDDYDRQTATTDLQLEQAQKQLDQTQEQQDETGRQLQRSKTQADRYEAQLSRWEQQADRQDKVLDGLERLLSRQGADLNGDKGSSE